MQMHHWLAMDTQRDYVCAVCWGPLVTRSAGEVGFLEVHCVSGERDECDGQGFVTRKYADRRRTESEAELWEVRHNYPDLIERRVRLLNEQRILAELGF